MSSPDDSSKSGSKLKSKDLELTKLSLNDVQKFIQLTRLYMSVKAERKHNKAEQKRIEEERKRKFEDDLHFQDMLTYLSSNQFLDTDCDAQFDSASNDPNLDAGASENSDEEEFGSAVKDLLHCRMVNEACSG